MAPAWLAAKEALHDATIIATLVTLAAAAAAAACQRGEACRLEIAHGMPLEEEDCFVTCGLSLKM